MDYYGLLFLYYLKGLSGKSILRLFFNIEVGGTEQLLPENTSTPTTTPILADIQYPDGLRTDQYFTYRETPTTVSNKARIKTIKGNTLEWNQLVQNGNFVNADNWTGNGTISVSNNEMAYTKPARWNSLSNSNVINIISGHKYLMTFEAYSETNNMLVFWSSGTGASTSVYNMSADTTWKKHSIILTATWTNNSGKVPSFDNNAGTDAIFHLRNYMFIDLTMMGLDSLTLDEANEWFNAYYPLPYYDYNQGSLLSFNGTGLKAVGKNQFNSEHAISATNVVESNDNGTITIKDVSSATWSNAYIGYSDVIAGKEYTFKASIKYGRIGGNLSSTSHPIPANQPDTSIGDSIFVVVTSAIPSRTFIPNFTGRIYWWYCTDINNANHQQFTMQPMLSTTDADFEPYTSSTTSLPISTYFPTGMDGINDVHDELTSSSYAKKFSTVTVDGSENWIKSSSYEGNYYARILGNAKLYLGKAVSTFTRNVARNTQELAQYDNCIYIDGESSRQTLNIKNPSISTLEDFKAWLTSKPVTVCYELVNPIENYGVVDLGTLEWRLGVYNELYTTISDMEKGVANVLPSVLCSKYQTIIFASRSQWTTPVITVPDDQNILQVRNTGITDPTAFKTAMSGVYLLYEKDSTETTPEEANNALSLLMGRSVSSNNAKQMIDIITKGE